MNEDKHLEEFFAVIESPTLWKGVFEEIRELRLHAKDGGWLSGGDFDSSPYIERVEFDLYRIFEYQSFTDVFERRLLGQFRFPPVTAVELAELSSQHLSGAANKDEIEIGVARFIAHLRKTTRYSSDDIHIGHEVAKIADLGKRLPKGLQDCESLWESDFGFRIAFSPTDTIFAPATIDI